MDVFKHHHFKTIKIAYATIKEFEVMQVFKNKFLDKISNH
jgi:hypothetical protein